MGRTKEAGKFAGALVSVIGTVFVAAGVGLTLDPWAPPYGGKFGVVLHLAYFAAGQYGPAIVFAGLGLFAWFWGLQLRRS